MLPKRTAKRESAFIGVLRRGGSVEAACAKAGFSRRSAFKWKAADPTFADRWNDAREAGTDLLEDKSTEFAIEGFVEYRETKRTVAKDGTVTELVTERRKVSERHLELQLRARRPEKYRERSSVEHSGPGGGPIEVTDARTRIAGKLDAIARRKALRVIDGGAPAGPVRADAG